MKRILSILTAITLITGVFLPIQASAQAQWKMNYQAVIRNSSDELIINTTIGMRINILQGTSTGTVVYTETQTPATNANGLVTIEIGAAAGFNNINWANGPYYIKTETDPSGGTNYTLTGTSQLLSVPYALHAKTAESITGTVTETDPVYTSSQAANITTTDITNLSNLSGTNTGDQNLSLLATTTSVTTGLALKVDKEAGKGLSTNDYTTAEKTKLSGLSNADGSETKVTAGTNVTVTGAGTTVSPYVVNASGGASDPAYDGNRIITLAGLPGVSGSNFNTATMAEFLNKVFFPPVNATLPTTTFSTATSTFPYSAWKNWSSFTTNLSFSWSATNVSLTDASDDKLVNSIKLKTGATVLETVTPTNPVGSAQSGTFHDVVVDNSAGNATTDFSKSFTLEVVDAQPNTITKNVTIALNKAIQMTYGDPTLTPGTLVYEYSNSNIPLSLGWSITLNDEAISSISVDGAVTGSTSTLGSQAVTFRTIANGGTQTKAFPLVVNGNLYGAGTSRNSPTVSWENRLYRGIISAAPCDAGFSFTDTQIKALASETKLGGNWKDPNGYSFSMGAGGYIAFAYPSYGAVAPTVQYKDPTFGWMTYDASNIVTIIRNNFSNQNGYTGTNYKLVFVCVFYAGGTVEIRLE